MEIERKWLVRRLPTDTPAEVAICEQLYVSLEPEVRLRKYVTQAENHIPFRLAIKGNGTLVREEIQEAVSEEFYNEVKRFVGKEPITKRCYNYNIGGCEICISDVDTGVFMYAEVEFETEEDADNYVFPWPELIIREVTNEKEYKMKNYWKRTRLDQ